MSAARGRSPTMKRWAMCRTPAAAAAPSAARPALRAGHPHRAPRWAAGGRPPPRGSRSGGGRGRRATGTRASRPRSGTARRAAPRPWRRAPWPCCVERLERVARPAGKRGVDLAPDLLKLRPPRRESYSAGYAATMPSLVLGPLLRYVGETEAVLWVETDSRVRGRDAGLARAHLLRLRSPLRARLLRRPRARHLARVRGPAGRRAVWPQRRRLPGQRASAPTRRRTPLKIVFGSCRVAAPHEPPYTLRKDEDPRGREIDALHTLALADARPAARRVARRAAHARRPGVRRRGLPGHARRSSRRGATRTRSPASACSTSRSTPSSTSRAGATRRSAGCSPPSRRR